MMNVFHLCEAHEQQLLANPLRLFCCFPLIEVSVGSLWYSWLD